MRYPLLELPSQKVKKNVWRRLLSLEAWGSDESSSASTCVGLNFNLELSERGDKFGLIVGFPSEPDLIDVTWLFSQMIRKRMEQEPKENSAWLADLTRWSKLFYRVAFPKAALLAIHTRAIRGEYKNNLLYIWISLNHVTRARSKLVWETPTSNHNKLQHTCKFIFVSKPNLEYLPLGLARSNLTRFDRR